MKTTESDIHFLCKTNLSIVALADFFILPCLISKGKGLYLVMKQGKELSFK